MPQFHNVQCQDQSLTKGLQTSVSIQLNLLIKRSDPSNFFTEQVVSLIVQKLDIRTVVSRLSGGDVNSSMYTLSAGFVHTTLPLSPMGTSNNFSAWTPIFTVIIGDVEVVSQAHVRINDTPTLM